MVHKMKRRLFTVFLCLVLTLCLFATAAAADTVEYALDDIGVTVSLPSDYIVFTRDMPEDHPGLADLGFTREEMLELLSSDSSFLDGFSPDYLYEVVVIASESPLPDLSTYGETSLEAFKTTFENRLASQDANILGSEFIDHEQTKLLKLDYSYQNNSATIYSIVYVTVYDGIAYTFGFNSFAGSMPSAFSALADNVISGASFGAGSVPVQNFTPTPAFTFNDPDSDASFTVPANWVESKDIELDSILSTQFNCLASTAVYIQYGSLDIWDDMTASERLGRTRDDFDSETITAGEMAELLDLSDDSVHKALYGNKTYYVLTYDASTELDIGAPVELNVAMYMRDGYLYYFQFIGDSESEYYSDFTSMLKSLKLPAPEPTPAPSPSAAPQAAVSDVSSTGSSGSEEIDDAHAVKLLLALFITLIVYALPIVIYRFAVKKAPVAKKRGIEIALIYGLCALVITVALLLAADIGFIPCAVVVLWGIVNYIILTSGAQSAEASPAPSAAAPGAGSGESSPERKTPAPVIWEDEHCYVCGAELKRGDRFCRNCGISTEDMRKSRKVKTYYSRDGAPLAFHTFFRYVCIPLSVLNLIGQFVLLDRSMPEAHTWMFAVDVLFSAVIICLLIASFIGFFKWQPYAWECTMAYLYIHLAYDVYAVILSSIYASGSVAGSSGQLLVAIAWTYGVIVYYRKRKPLFFTELADAVRPAPAGADLTAVRCPNCGAELPGGSRYCSECGTELRSRPSPEYV